MVEVDPKLFVTCRLCLNVTGKFQIVPVMQQQIKYCFDIDVQQFDRLPQLICKKCDSILTEYYATKKNFIEKQEELKAKVQDNTTQGNQLTLSHVDESYICSTNDNKIIIRKRKHKTKKSKKKKIINRFVSSSGSDSGHDELSKATSELKRRCGSIEEPKKWQDSLCKYFVCRICSQRFTLKEEITKHVVEHGDLGMKYKNIFNTSCLVVMEKIDKKPNLVNSDTIVMYTSDYFIENKHNPYYCTIYRSKAGNYAADDSESKSIKVNNNSQHTKSDILSSKRRRTISGSSSETIVINQHSEDESSTLSKNNGISPTVIDCIDIGDSSDNDSSKSHEIRKSSPNSDRNDFKIISNVIEACYNTYVKRDNCPERKFLESLKHNEKSLQRKLLSIGIKCINSTGFKCTGLLRYMEYKDLNVTWKETGTSSAGIDGKYARIATRMRNNESNDSSNMGWKDIIDYKRDKNTFKKGTNVLRKLSTFRIFNVWRNSNGISIVTEDPNLSSIAPLPVITSVYSHPDLEISKIVDSDTKQHKLLNPNPVPNPKQPPKKQNEFSSIKITNVVSTSNNTESCIDVKHADEYNHISSDTVSSIPSDLVSTPLHEKDVALNDVSTRHSVNTSDNSIPIQYPRIKVKPASELMAQNHTSQDNVFQGSPNVLFLSHQMVSLSEQQNFQVSVNSKTQSFKTGEGYVLLDINKVPNKTDSPFEYLKNRLMTHNITLLDTSTQYPEKLTCLNTIKFMCQQNNCQPIILLLSLYSLRNIFSIVVKDTQRTDVPLNKLSAEWQRQILRILNNNIAQKFLQTAEKIDTETHHFTKIFFSVLKSL